MLHQEQPLDQISTHLIQYLRAKLDSAAVAYQIPLTQMEGGFETYTYRFQLGNVPPAFSVPLILRLYPSLYGPDKAIWESTIQNALADAGYPVPRVHVTCTDTSILGGAFLIMAFLPGELMLKAPFETIPVMLGHAHAALHSIDPGSLIESLHDQGFDERRYRLDGRLGHLSDRATNYPWLHDSVDWLLQNRPPEPDRLSICHGDFHPMNILVQDGHVTGVLDWPGFIVADPALDIACTIALTSISAKHILSLAAWEPVVEMYLGAYRSKRSFDADHLAYYRVRRCIFALLEGAEGHQVWQQPAIVRDLCEYTHQITGIPIVPRARSCAS